MQSDRKSNGVSNLKPKTKKQSNFSNNEKIKNNFKSRENVLKEPLETKRSLPVEDKQKTSETLHWKDTPSKGRRASLPCEVKLLEPSSALLSPEIMGNYVL